MELRWRTAHLLGSLWVVRAGGLWPLGLGPVSEAWVQAWAWGGELVGLPNSHILRGLPSKLSGARLIELTGNGADFPWDSCQHGTSNFPLELWRNQQIPEIAPHGALRLVISPMSLAVIVAEVPTSMGPAVSPGIRYLHSYPHFTVITKWLSNPGDLNWFWRKQLFLFVLITDMRTHVRCKWNNAVGFLLCQD